MNRFLLFLILSAHILVAQRNSETDWDIRLGITTGSAYNVPGKLTVKQPGYEDFTITAKWTTNAFKMPIYWDLLGEFHKNDWLYGLHFMHHKLVLTNEHPLLNRISITHGYNIFNAYVGKKIYNEDIYLFDLMAGVGVAFSHPEGEVRGYHIARRQGVPLSGGFYDVSYPNFEIGLHRDWDLTNWLLLRSTLKSTYFSGEIEHRNGSFQMNTLSFHWNLGLLGKIGKGA